jgi:hypothetical protein
MSQLLLQVVIVVAFGALCFRFSNLSALIVTPNQWRDDWWSMAAHMRLCDFRLFRGLAGLNGIKHRKARLLD